MGFRQFIREFRLRRFIYARGHRNPIVKALARQAWKNWSAFENQDFRLTRNGETWLAARIGNWFTVSSSGVYVDVGANMGEWSDHLSADCPFARVHAIEIAPSTYEGLRSTIGTRPNVTLHNVGFADKAGEMTLYLNRSSETTGLYHHPAEAKVESVTAQVVRGDDFLDAQSIAHVHFMKIDVEGAEFDVLAGLEKSLASGRIDVIQFEYGIFNIASRRLLKDFYEVLSPHYRIGKLFPRFVEFRDYHITHEDFAPANYIAVRRELTSLIDHLAN
jgi:FkbM family methyltransferase